MTELTRDALVILRAIWHRRWTALGVTWIVALLLGAVIWLIPNRYEANAKLFVDTQSVLKPLMAGLAFQPDLDQQVRMLARTVLSRPNMERLMKDPDVEASWATPEARERAIDALGLKIKIEHTGGNLYAISYRDTDARRAKAVVAGLIELFMDTGADSKQRDSQEASRFIDEQIKTYEGKLIESENRLKDFKLRNFGVSGVSNQDYFARTSALTDEVNRLQLALTAAEQSRDALKRELASEDPQLPAILEPAPTPSVAAVAPPPAPVVQPPSELDMRLDAQRRQLDDLLRRYTDEHPDVVAVRRTINQIEQQRQAEIEARAKAQQARAAAAAAAAAAATPSGVVQPTVSRTSGNNPVYQRLRIAHAEAEANVASLRSQLSGSQARLEQIRALATRVPQAEAELAQLTRDYEIMQSQYKQLVGRREAASLGVKIDESAHMAEFRIVEPPRIAPRPVFPDQLTLAALGAIAALAAGLAAAIGLSKLFPTIDSLDALKEFTKRPVLGIVSRHMTARNRVQRRFDLMKVAGALALFLVVQAAWISTLVPGGHP